MNKQKEIDAKHGQLAISFCFFNFQNFILVWAGTRHSPCGSNP
jgi:hypothetical protein